MTATSYGLIVFSKTEDGIKFLIYQRRDNYEYIDILRGKWRDLEHAKKLCFGISVEERQRLLTYPFKQLWDDLWIIHDSFIHRHKYLECKAKFEKISSVIKDHLKSIDPKILKDNIPIWGFPKGQRFDNKEGDLQCAAREFKEETKLENEELYVWDIKPINEYYKGNDGKFYSTNYFLAESQEEMNIARIKTPHGIRSDAVSEEAADAEWVSFEEACLKLNTRRQNILTKVMGLITGRYRMLSPLFKTDQISGKN